MFICRGCVCLRIVWQQSGHFREVEVACKQNGALWLFWNVDVSQPISMSRFYSRASDLCGVKKGYVLCKRKRDIIKCYVNIKNWLRNVDLSKMFLNECHQMAVIALYIYIYIYI